MSNEFVHSVTVPRIYKFTADIVRRVREDGASLKTLIYERKHPNVAGIYGLSVNTLRALPQLDRLLDKTQILTEQPRLNPWLAKVLITELLWRKGCLKSRSKPVLTVLAYENRLREESKSLDCTETLVVHKEKETRSSAKTPRSAVKAFFFMVLIIRNCRILSSRPNKQVRVGKLQDRQNRSCRRESICNKKNNCAMGPAAVLGTLFLYSVAMFTLPFAAFFGVQRFMILEFQTDTAVTNYISVLAAVVTVNLIISCYAYQALNESVEEKEQSEDQCKGLDTSVSILFCCQWKKPSVSSRRMDGNYYPKASCLPVHLLDPVSGSVVLDMCAAPGMKATHAAAKLQNYGKVYAVEIDAKRFETLLSQMKKTHSLCVEPLNQDALTLDPKKYSHALSTDQNRAIWMANPSQSVWKTYNRSKYALFNFPNAKRIIYSTCSLHPEENEEVIDEVLADIGNAYHLVPVRQLLKNNWTNFSSKKYNCGDTCLYSKPDDDFCNGFFVAVFERNFDVTLPKCKHKGGNEYRNVIRANLNVKKDDMAKTDPYEREKCVKKKKKKKEEISTTVDGQGKISTDIVKFVVSEIENKGKVKTKEAKCSEKEVEKMDVRSNLSNLNHKLALNKSKDIQKRISDEMEAKKSRKQRLKCENALEVEIDNDTLDANYGEKEQNEEIETKLSKIKRRKKKATKEIVKIDKIYFQKKKQQEEIAIVPSKKRKRNEENS
ncbi:putative methyltransferase NSUN5 [Temnothorax longispinosus]|uniref:Putative methyltransferase NSUN5 n=1 Tax=Temnothorax longispinosus TaxID=300112 RepID=A0A4S2JA75_9HYME|nr:putative methyltransferase NSUN5 [Temnothorax longispinosus]